MKTIPPIGLGTWQLKGEECTRVVRKALDLGYRHIDTASMYENHKEIGKGIQGFSRSEFFLTSKIALNPEIDLANVAQSVRIALEKTLKELHTDYLDLYLIHWPERKYPLDLIFQTMSVLKETKYVGVSNYTVHHLKDMQTAGLHPYVNQVEFHPYLVQRELLEYCRKHNIRLISYRSLGKGDLLLNPLFRQLAAAKNKTPAQIILRWLVQQEIPVIPKAASEKHLQDNLALFDFALSQEEMQQISQLNRDKRYCEWEGAEFDY